MAGGEAVRANCVRRRYKTSDWSFRMSMDVFTKVKVGLLGRVETLVKSVVP